MTFRFFARCLIGALVCAPLSLVITLSTWPFWGWFEGVSGIESLGHSGPATWCFFAVYLLLVVGWFLLLWYTRQQER